MAKKHEKPEPLKHDVNTCLKKIIKNAKKADESIEHVSFELAGITRIGAIPRRYKTGQVIRITRLNSKGKEVVQKTFISHEYCPFCGTKF